MDTIGGMKLLLLVCLLFGQAQTPPKSIKPEPPKPNISSDELLEVTKFVSQYRKLLIIKQENEKELTAALTETLKKIAAWEKDHMPKDMDLKTHYFDWDELKYLERPKKDNKK
jgi:hypothetical protein